MKALREKLHSQRGASILLALLFLLVCMMVAASVLMAAVSNAGKIRSNYEEQQRYLALSSALRLVAGELERAEYRGRYDVDQWTEQIKVIEADGTETVTETKYYRVIQRRGAFACGQLAKLVPDADGNLTQDGTTVLSFQKELDGLFAKEFSSVGYRALPEKDENGKVQIASLPTNPPDTLPGDPSRTTRVLTVTVEGDPAINETFGSVKVDVDMSQSRRIHLKAVLEIGAAAYTMEAELTASGAPTIIYIPGDRLPKDGRAPETDVTEIKDVEFLKDQQTDPVTWQLDWITREVKKEAAGG